jgi:hypothetical protein
MASGYQSISSQSHMPVKLHDQATLRIVEQEACINYKLINQ